METQNLADSSSNLTVRELTAFAEIARLKQRRRQVLQREE
jgi:hypothetical protein